MSFVSNVRKGEEHWIPVKAQAQLTHVADLDQLEEVSLRGDLIRDRDLACLKNLFELENLQLRGTRVSDVGLPILRPFPRCATDEARSRADDPDRDTRSHRRTPRFRVLS